MKSKLLAATLLVASLLVSNQRGFAAATNDPSAELKELVGKVQVKLKAGQKTEKDLAPEIGEFDALLAEHKGEKTDGVAQILLMKALLYKQVLNDPDKYAPLIEQLKRDFPDSKVVASMRQQEEAETLRANLVEGAKFPDFTEKDVTGKPLSIGNYKGKVVLLDFWATWCGPCVAELPNVLNTYKKHHGQGFDIIGISLDQDKSKLTSFTEQKQMPWQQFFDGQGWQNKLAVKYGVQSIPATYLLDGEGKIIGKDLRGELLEEAVTKVLAAK
jgi:peroxiredoxin